GRRTQVFWKRKSPGRPWRFPGRVNQVLFEFDLRTRVFELLLGVFGGSLVDTFLDGLGRAVDQVLGFLEAQTGDFAHGLDDADLVGADFRQHDGELGLLFGSGGSAAGGRRGSHGNRG